MLVHRKPASSTESLSSASDQQNPLPSNTLLVPSLKRRMACWIYEGVLLFGVVFLAGYLFSTLSQTRNAMDNRHALQAFVFLVFGVYFTWFWRHGQTLAMKTWKIRITNLDGLPVSQKQAIFRYVLCWIWFVPPLAFSNLMDLHGLNSMGLLILWVTIWAISSKFNSSKQFWQDNLAKTQLVLLDT
jgi:uncharacterized RDD family membrane protein YckC